MLQWFTSNNVAMARGNNLYIASQSEKSFRKTECPENTTTASIKTLHRKKISFCSDFSTVIAWICPINSSTHKTQSVLFLCFSKTAANCSKINGIDL